VIEKTNKRKNHYHGRRREKETRAVGGLKGNLLRRTEKESRNLKKDPRIVLE